MAGNGLVFFFFRWTDGMIDEYAWTRETRRVYKPVG